MYARFFITLVVVGFLFVVLQPATAMPRADDKFCQRLSEDLRFIRKQISNIEAVKERNIDSIKTAKSQHEKNQFYRMLQLIETELESWQRYEDMTLKRLKEDCPQ
jgi:hypothetical protein